MLRIREQFLRRLVLLDLAVVDEDDAVGHLAGEAHFVGDHQHGDAGVGQLLHQFQNLAHHFGVEGAGGLVEQDHVRVHGKGTGNGNALLLAAGKALGVGVGLVGQAHAGQQLIALLGAVSIFFVALLYLFRTQILTVMFGHIEPDVMAATNTYYLYVMASIPGIALYNGGAALFRTMGHSDVSLKVSLLMNSINVIGNAVLIFGFGMDVAGVAIPTLVSRTVAAVVILSLLFNRDLMLHLSDIRGFRVDMRLMKNIFYIGVPSGVENGMFQLGRLVLFSLISTFGTASMVANAIGNTISNFNCFAGQAINLGLAAVVSQCVGAGEFDQARAYLKKIAKWTYGIMAAVNLTIIALLPLIMRVYNVSPEAEKLAVTVTLIHGISSIFIWVPAFMVPGFLRAAGDAKFTMLASMLTMWVVRVLLAYVLGKYMGYGVIGVWFAHAIVDWSVRGAIFFLRYRSGKWETMGIKT